MLFVIFYSVISLNLESPVVSKLSLLINNLLGKRLGYARGEDETTGDESPANLLMKETFSDTWICTNKIQSK